MFRKIMAALFLLLGLPVLSIPARASRQEGSVRVCPDWGGDLAAGGSVSLYRVGEPVTGGYRMTDGLADWTVWEEDVYSQTTREWLLGHEHSAGVTMEVDEREGALFSGLAEGLYLVMQETSAVGFTSFSPVLVSIPQDDLWDIGLSPPVMMDTEPPKTADHPAPIIGAMGLGLSVAVLMVLVDSRKK